ncbi:hypothetical protein OH146_10810 [Salinibacterium sp. SYSU T00001]|uniref:hypothetical protein n=1 Tax=Homoserinimonas sedimenticola TaxID=2986805 RepID=UPI002236488C|nr:hypothetical protein [Salinibacterium sedimenticola]MCW4386262.1 hypothetical protein [Salinibacterium sedimenticola]
MSNHEHDRHNRAEAPLGALSPGSTATGEPSETERQWLAEFGTVPPHVTRSPADPEALVRGQRVTTAHDMEPGPLPEGNVGGGDMMDRTPHPEQPAEGSDKPGYTEGTAPQAEESTGDTDDDSVGEDILAAAPGRLNQDLDEPSKSDPEDLGPEHPVGSP